MTTGTNSTTTHCAPTPPLLASCVSILPNDYSQMENLPKINGVTLLGDKSANELGILSIKPKDYETVNLSQAAQRGGFLIIVGKDQEPMKLSVEKITKRGLGFFTNDEVDPDVKVGVYQFVQKK